MGLHLRTARSCQTDQSFRGDELQDRMLLGEGVGSLSCAVHSNDIAPAEDATG